MDYLSSKPPADIDRIFIWRRLNPLGIDGVRYIVEKYGVAIGMDIHPHALGHIFAT